MEKVFSMAGTADKSCSPPAHFPQDFDHYAFWDLVENLSTLEEWTVPELHCHGKLGHFAPTDWLGRLCSPTFREVVEPFCPKALWLPTPVSHDGPESEYYFLHFATIPDVLDRRKTLFVHDEFVHPHFVKSKVQKHKVFIMRKLGGNIFVLQTVKEAVQAAGIKGVEFQTVPAT